MTRRNTLPIQGFRIWIVRSTQGRPTPWSDLPRAAWLLEPAERECFSAADAEAYLEAFNVVALGEPRTPGEPSLWAIAVPLCREVEQALRPGLRLTRRMLAQFANPLAQRDTSRPTRIAPRRSAV